MVCSRPFVRSNISPTCFSLAAPAFSNTAALYVFPAVVGTVNLKVNFASLLPVSPFGTTTCLVTSRLASRLLATRTQVAPVNRAFRFMSPRLARAPFDVVPLGRSSWVIPIRIQPVSVSRR